MAFPKASIVLLTYNQEAFVAQALASLLAPDNRNLKIAVSDQPLHDETQVIMQFITHSYRRLRKISFVQIKRI